MLGRFAQSESLPLFDLRTCVSMWILRWHFWLNRLLHPATSQL